MLNSIGMVIIVILVLFILIPILLYIWVYVGTHAFISVILQVYINKLKSHVEKKKKG